MEFEMKKIKIAPSVLAADMLTVGDEIKRAAAAGADMLHLDVMDGVYVPNISFGFDVIKSIGSVTSVMLDVHMMTCCPDKYIDRLVECGADSVTIHEGTCCDTRAALEQIRDSGMRAALALKPAESADILADYIDIIDMALIMTVEPGFGGQSFMCDMLPKIEAVRDMVIKSGREIDIQVDGGINLANAELCASCGANVFVAGTYLFKSADMKAECDKLRTVHLNI